MKPNIFNLATKELSQDGFLTWLLQWADSENQSYDKYLHVCAKDFVKKLIGKQIDYTKEIQKVKAGRQWKNIDVWAEVNDEILIIIEDKTFTQAHSNQLIRYKEIAKNWCKKNNYSLVCIYVKIGSEAISSLDKIRQKGFSVIDREELIKSFISHSNVKNDIFIDFKERIELLEKNEKSYKTSNIENWIEGSWLGFYQFLETKLNVKEWKYVSNPNGGFWGLWWHFLDWKNYYVYLQIEQGNLCFKIGEVYSDKSAIRNEWFSIIMQKAKENGKIEIERPNRFGTGTYMTVAIIKRENWLGENSSCINEEKIIERLKEYEKFLTNCLLK